MLVGKAIERIRKATHDETLEYDNDECVFALNTATHEIAALLIYARMPILVREETINDGDSLPKGFFKTAGTYPIRITGNTIKFLDDTEKMKIRYFFLPDELVGTDEEAMPFDLDILNGLVIKVAVKMLLNENEFDISQDQAIQQELMQAIQQGWNGA